MRVVTCPADRARAAIARAWLGDAAADAARLGAVSLRPHQLRAVARLRRALRDFGGALLADAVGLGKTYVALALARDAERPLVVAPAALRATWERAAAAAGVPLRFVSFEALSRGRPPDDRPRDGPLPNGPMPNASATSGPPPDGPSPVPPSRPDLVVVDEAHHVRNPATRRHRALAEIAARARVLLLSATPVHNRARDLAAILSLFLGRRAADIDADTLARLVVRRTARDVAASGAPAECDAVALPTVRRARWLPLPDAPDVVAALRAVPPPLPPRDGGAADALWTLGLVHLWASSDGALRAALHRRLARAVALASALDQGRHLSARDLRRWAVDASVVQLELPLPDGSGPTAPATLRATLRAHERGLRAALAALPADDPRDRARAALLRDIRHRHPGRPVLAFTAFADTARALYRRLAPDGGVALLTGTGGRVAGGTLSRHEVVARFAPRASGVPPPRPAERVDLLLATDCLSEGLDLHDAAVVVHLDVPWTPARLAQRVGRAARIGAPHPSVAVYGLAPPGGAAAWLRLGARLRAKSAAARDSLGPGTLGAGLAPRGVSATWGCARARGPSTASRWLRVARILERWAPCSPGVPTPGPARTLVAAVATPAHTYLALCLEDGRPLLLAGRRGRATASVRAIERALRLVDAGGASPSSPPHVPPDRLRRILAELRRRGRARAAARLARGAVDDTPAAASSLRRAVLARAGAIVAAAPPHLRPAVARLAAELRAGAERAWSAGVERDVARLAALSDAAWLPAVAGALRGAPVRAEAVLAGSFRVVTILVLGP